mgnify:CR=1 FL=1
MPAEDAGHRGEGGHGGRLQSRRQDGGYSFGAALSTYTKKGNKWVFGGEYLLKNNPYKDTKIPVAQFTAEGGYYFKILSAPERLFSSMPGLRLSPDMRR